MNTPTATQLPADEQETDLKEAYSVVFWIPDANVAGVAVATCDTWPLAGLTTKPEMAKARVEIRTVIRRIRFPKRSEVISGQKNYSLILSIMMPNCQRRNCPNWVNTKRTLPVRKDSNYKAVDP
jgi:hypothetical protein